MVRGKRKLKCEGTRGSLPKSAQLIYEKKKVEKVKTLHVAENTRRSRNLRLTSNNVLLLPFFSARGESTEFFLPGAIDGACFDGTNPIAR